MTAEPLPFLTRLWFAFVCWVRLLADGAFARQVWLLGSSEGAATALPEPPPKAPALVPVTPAAPAAPVTPAAPKAAEPAPPAAAVEPPAAKAAPALEAPAPSEAALQLLALLQREGRFIDFLEEDIAGFGDEQVGGVARVVHEGCRKALREHVALEAVRAEDEGARVRLESGFDAGKVKLVGNVQGAGPFEGVLRHRGWRAREVRLPTLVRGADARLLAPAEVEL
ncbi:MAG TPA: DUF2760 domain-containing protein [Polyangiaceae bacterium]|nr:DUF2760 domain-containing protein [Polyangiaceae bacterium]